MNTLNTKYRIGDYVLVDKNLTVGNNYKMENDPAVTQTFTDEMSAFCGNVVQIRSFSDNGDAYLIDHPTLEDEGAIWTDEMFTGLVAEESGKECFITDTLALIECMAQDALNALSDDSDCTFSDEALEQRYTSVIYAAAKLSELTGIVVKV